jgi:hypothetical protein
MARNRKITAAKRQRERTLAERRQEKLAKRAETKHNQSSHATAIDGVDGVDPDIAGIVPGPQPPLAWQVEE